MILAIDQGTTGTTCLVFDTDGELGVWTQDRVVSGWREAARFEPRMEAAERDEPVAQWRRAVERVRGWAVSG